MGAADQPFAVHQEPFALDIREATEFGWCGGDETAVQIGIHRHSVPRPGSCEWAVASGRPARRTLRQIEIMQGTPIEPATLDPS